MARITIPTTKSNPHVATPMSLTPVNAVEGVEVDKQGLKLLYIKNDGALPCEVTLRGGSLVTGAFLGQGSVSDLRFTVPAGGVHVVGEPETARFQQGSRFHLDFDQGAGVTIAAITV